MTLTFTGYDQSQECRQWINYVHDCQGFVSHAKYSKHSKATVELTAFVPEQPELIKTYGCDLANQLHPLREVSVDPAKPGTDRTVTEERCCKSKSWPCDGKTYTPPKGGDVHDSSPTPILETPEPSPSSFE